MKQNQVAVLLVSALFLGVISGFGVSQRNLLSAQAQAPTPQATALPPAVTFDEGAEQLFQAQDVSSPEMQMVALMNQERATKGLPPLAINSFLTKAALIHSQDMADHNLCAHEGSNGDSPWQRIPGAGYTGSLGGETVACGQTSVQQAFEGWKASPGHYAILMGQYGEVGLGWVTKPGTNFVNYWTADFGGSPGKTTPGSNPGAPPTATVRVVFPTQPPIFQWTATPRPSFPTPIPFFTPTPRPQQPTPVPVGGGWRVTLDCNQFGVCQGVLTPK